MAGRILYRSTTAGLMVGYLALLGVNPAGPAIAGAKYLLRGEPLFEQARPDPGGDVFVTDVQADDRMAKPLLGALYIQTDWRPGQNIVWFFDVSSRGPALALLVLLAFLFAQDRSGALVDLSLVGTGALVTALNPVIGVATAGTLCAAAAITWTTGCWFAPEKPGRRDIRRSMLFLVGAALASPTYLHLTQFPGSVAISQGRFVVLKTAAMVAGFALLLPLAWQGRKGASGLRAESMKTMTVAGSLLILAVVVAGLAEGNEHNFANAASCLLAVPAAGWIVAGNQGKRMNPLVRAGVLVIAFLPITVGTLVAFSGRPDVPLRFDGTTLRRTDPSGVMDAFYRWAANATPPTAVFISNPTETVKMSGNVSEIPAFIGRALFVDKPTYMTSPYADLALRNRIAAEATSGMPLDPEQLAYLRNLRRPLYVIIFHADQEEVMARLARAFGQAAFRKETVAVFSVVVPSQVGTGLAGETR